MKTGTRSPEGRGITAATIAFVAMLMIGQTAPMEYVRDVSETADTVIYHNYEFSVEENSNAPVLDLFSTVSNADDCKMYVQGNDYLDNGHFSTPTNGIVSPDATMADVGMDYENPQDADGDNSYEFRVRTHCPGNDITARNYFLNVTNIVFDFYGSDSASFPENVAANSSVWSPTGMNDTTVNCAIDDTSGNFDVNASTCAITVSETASFDHETSPTITLNVSASTAGDLESDYHIVTVTVTDVNETPTGYLEITGTLTDGETISADATGVSDQDGMNMTDAEYQWYRGGATIVGETASTYTLTNDDSLQSMQVSMTYNDTAGRSTMVMSNATAAVADVDNNDPASTAIPNQAVPEDATTTIDVSGYFSDADPTAVLSYAVSGVGFATINSTGVIFATPAQGDVTHTSAGAIQLTTATVYTATVTSTNATGVVTTLCTISTSGNDADASGAVSEACTFTIPAGSTGEATYTSSTLTATASITDTDTTSSTSMTEGAITSLGVGNYSLALADSSSVADTFASNQATVTVTDEDGTATSQTLYMNVTNANDAFTLGSYTLGILGDAYDGSQLAPGYTAQTQTTYDSSVTSFSDAGDYVFTYTHDPSWSAYGGHAFQINYGSSSCNSGGSAGLAYAGIGGFTCSFSLAAGETATVTVYNQYTGYVMGTWGTVYTSPPTTVALDTTLLSDEDGMGALTYQWYADGAAITGATSSTYTLEANNLSLIGNTYSVEITQTDAFGTDESMMSSSTAALTLNPAGDLDGDTVSNSADTDVDGDGYNATDQGDGLVDAFEFDQHAWADNDNDGAADSLATSLGAATVSPYGTANDTDDDNDGTPDATDAFPFDATEDVDADGDNIGANTDDVENDACYSVDTDGDGFPDAGTGVPGCVPTLVEDSDDDGDGIANVDDCNVSDATQMYDTDGDGICNSVDADDDGDGVADWYDDYPLDSNAQYNADGDAFNNTVDADDDNDGITDDLDDDTDGDGYDDINDWAPGDPDEWVDTDSDGLGDNYDTDDDEDGVLDATDGCPLDAGASLDSDGDGLCDATADDDDDDDGVLDVDDAFDLDPDASVDSDGDGKADSLNPNLPTEDAYTSVEICSMTLTSTPVLIFNNYEAISCAPSVPSNVNSVTVSLTYGNSWASETALYVLPPGATSYDLIYSGSNSAGGTTSTLSYTAAGTYTLYLIDTYGDGCAGCLVTVTYDYLSGSQEAQSSPYGTLLDNDDDDDGVDDALDAWRLDDCADTDTDGDGAPDSVCAADDFNSGWNVGSGSGIGTMEILSSGSGVTVDIAEYFATNATEPSCVATISWVGYNTDTGAWDPIYEMDLCNGDAYGPSEGASVTTVTCPTSAGCDGTYGHYEVTLIGNGTGTSVAYTALFGQPADTDDDNDGTPDIDDAFRTDASEDTDTDGDGVGNNADTDDDSCPAAANVTLGITCNSLYYPGDGVVDANEASGCTMMIDCDGDGYIDSIDTFPTDSTEWIDTDGDGLGNNADIDDDGDGVSDAYDWAPLNSSEWRDFDGDGDGDTNDTDDDNDGVADTEDAYPYDASESADNDGDGVGDNTDMDDDDDGVDDYDSSGAQLDNCRTTVNANQANNDGDTAGDLCDDDDDNDGTDDVMDAYPMNDAASVDTDGDGLADDFLQTNVTSVMACTALNTAGTASVYCAGTVTTTGETLVYTLVTANTWASDLTVTALMPNGDIVTLADRDMDVSTTYTWTFSAVGSYNLTMTDFFMDGGDSAYSGFDLLNRLSENLTGTLNTPETSSGGLTLDTDDDGDGYSDADETAGCAGEQAYAGYESTSDRQDSSSTPADMDGDKICDGLDTDRDGDGDFNYDVDYDGSVNYLHGDSEDVFPDDPAEKDDNDNDGTGDNADTDDDNDMWTDVLENTCSGSETDGHSNQYDASSLPDDYDSDMDCNTFDVDDDNDGVNDGPDPHPLDECYWSDNDQDGIADYNNEGGCIAHMTSFESGNIGGVYSDADYNTSHDLENMAGMAEVNYDTGSVYTSSAGCPEGGLGSYVAGAGSCSVTVPAGGYAVMQAYWPYGFPYVSLNSTSPAGVVTDITYSASSGLTLTEVGTWTFQWTDDPGYPTIAILASEYTPLTALEAAAQGLTPYEIGYQASWAPSANTGTGLSDGDFVGVTDYDTKVDAYLDGRQGYTVSDPDGAYTLTFDPIDPTGLTAVVSYFLEDTGYEADDSVDIRYVGATSTVSLLSASGDDMELIDGNWTTVTADISAAGIGSLVVTFDSNSASESLYLDNVYFTTSYVVLDSDDDNDARLDGYDWCPLDPTEQDDNDEDGICDDTDLDDDNDGVFDFNDEFPLDGTESIDADGDGIGDNADTDDDNDGTDDDNDAFPNDPSEQDDFDGDGVGDNADTDDDGDGVSDVEDVWPLDNTMSTDTDGDGTADFFLTPAPYSLMDFESGSLPTEGTWTSYSCSIAGASAPVHPSVTCTNSTLYGPWAVTSSNAISGTYSLDSGQNSGQYGTTSIMVQFETLGGTATWDWKVSSFFRDYASVYYDGLEVWADGVKIPATSLGSACANDVWCGEDSGSMSWDFGAGMHDLTFTFRSGTSGQGGTNQAWIDNLQLPMNGVSNQMDTDDDNDGILDGDDLMQYDPCVGLDNDGDGAYDEMVGVGGAGVDLDGMACDTSAYDIDSNDDNDDWSDVDEVNCGTDPMDSTDFPGDFDGDLTCDPVDPDDDNDGVEDGIDAFPNDPYESSDLDGDEIGDNADNDDDGDGYLDGADAFPTDATEWIDSDGDGIGDNTDTDDDGDGVADDLDAFPLDDSESVDSDGDGFGDNIDPDDDGDGILDESDSFPNDSTEAVDTDGDGIGDVQDNDDDGDGVEDSNDAFPLDSSETTDFDGDGIGDNSDSDIDGDGYSNALDEFDYDSWEWGDVDGDGIGDNADSDNDNDGVADELDAFPFDASETVDMDGDGVGDNADADDDGDSYNDDVDAFPADENEWLDTDGDGTGNNADSDDDGDGFSDANENDCGTDTLDDDDTPPDYDGDGICDALDPNVDINIDEAPAQEDLGFGAAVPGFPTALAALALVGAALVAGRRTEE